MPDPNGAGAAVVALVGLGPRLRLQGELAEMQLVLQSGGVLRLVSWVAPSSHLSALLDDVVVLGKHSTSTSRPARVPAAAPAPHPPPQRSRTPGGVLRLTTNAVRSPARYARRARQLARQRTRRSHVLVRARRVAGRPGTLLLTKVHTALATAALLRSSRARAVLDTADVLVALDLPSVLVVKAAARRRPEVSAVLGLQAARLRVGRIGQGSGVSPGGEPGAPAA